MIDEVFARMRAAIAAIDTEVAKRRAVSTVDAVADGMAFAAHALRSELDQIEIDTEEISTEQFAAMHGVSPQIVTTWIRHGELEARREGQPYKIRRNARRVRRHLSQAS